MPGSLKASFKASLQQKLTEASSICSHTAGLRNYHGAFSSFISLIFKFVTVPRKPMLCKPQKEQPKNWMYLWQLTTDLLVMAWKSTPRRDLLFSRLKVTQGTNLELWTAICWCIWKTKGGDRKRTEGSQVPSDVSLGCVCVCVCEKKFLLDWVNILIISHTNDKNTIC